MARARIFTPGRVITSLGDLDHCARVGCWLYWNDGRPKHPSIITNQRFSVVSDSIRSGRIRVAERILPTTGETE